MSNKQIFSTLTASFLLLFCQNLTAFADVALPDGAVKGLPERLAALDNEGNAVNSATGEYFFHVENMTFGVTYVKEIQLMNLREDDSYHIWFSTEPLSANGEIDLEKGCVCTFFLDDVQFYQGDVNGHGNIDLTEKVYDLGWYTPGDSHTLRAEIIWNDINVTQHRDNGHRLIDKDGEHILVQPDGSGHAEGEIAFKWIFYAAAYDTEIDVQTTIGRPNSGDNDTNVSTPSTVQTEVFPSSELSDTDRNMTDVTAHTTTTTTVTTRISEMDGFFSLAPLTGYLPKDGMPWLIGMGAIGGLIIVLLILIHRKKR